MNNRSAEDWQKWVEEFSKGQNTEAWRGIMCFFRWLQVRAEQGHAVPNVLMGLEGDLYYSHLLRRLLDGKDPLPFPPPEANGGGWYDLIEAGQAVALDVKPWEWAPDQKIAINQGIWTIVQKNSEVDFVVTYRQNGEPFRLTRQDSGEWLLERIEA